jgi:hypothetical protein
METLGWSMDSGMFTALAAVCLVVFSISMLRRSNQRVATSRQLTREQLARLRDQKEIRQSMDELLIQLEETARRVNAQVDTRFAKLEAVIRDADERIAKLEQLTVQASSAPGSQPAAPPPRPANPEESPPPPRQKRATEPAATADGVSQTDHPKGMDEKRARIYALADQGASAMTIADALELALGEVELILDLRRLT